MSQRLGSSSLKLRALDERLRPDNFRWTNGPAQTRPWEDGRLWTRPRRLGSGVASLLGTDGMTAGVWAAWAADASGGTDQGRSRIAWFGAEVLHTADVDRIQVAWFGIEVLSPLEDRVRVGWFGMEAVCTGDVDRARVAWLGMEVLLTGRVTFTPVPDVIPDDGGTEMSSTLEAGWPATGVYMFVDLGDGSDLIPCYSGSIGDEFLCIPDATGEVLEWVAPPLPVGGPYTLYAQTPDLVTFEAFSFAIQVVRRSYTTNLYSLRSLFPPPRDVGPYVLSDEEG